MSSRLAHRGPDGTSLWASGPVGLASLTLHTTSISDEIKPCMTRYGDDAIVVVADVRIDNRRELLQQLGLRTTAEEISDSDLILAAYQAWRRRTPERLIGDFAFAIWDHRRRTLFCARDPVGVRPLYYHLSARLFAFGSEIKALFGVPEVPREIDEVQIGFYLENFIDEAERTMYRGIRRLPAAHFLELSPGHARLERYWAFDLNREICYSSSDQYADAFREVFVEAVRCRLRDADPVGAALSGGLDSSSVVCVARRLLSEDTPLHAFSAVFPGLPEEERQWNDESEYIDEVTRTGGVVSHRIPLDSVSPLDDYDRVFWHLDSPPMAGFNMYMSWALYRAAQRQGVRVFLAGTDGDSVVSKGFDRFIDLANEGRWETFVREVIALTERHQYPRYWYPKQLIYPRLVDLARSGKWRSWLRASNEIASGLGRSRWDLLLRYGIGAFIPKRILNAYQGRGWKTESARPLIRSGFARRVRLSERIRELTPKAPRSARESHASVLSLPRFQLTMELIDGAAAAFEVQPRYPFFDRRLMEFCVAIPAEEKLTDGWPRSIHRRGMEGILPAAIQTRLHKGRLGYNFTRRMHEIEGSKLEATLFENASVLEEFVDLDVLRAAHRRFLAPESSMESKGDDAMMLYKAVVLARWFRDHGHHAS
jgi:asparagine synthase (glutamine-hydrolysing)